MFVNVTGGEISKEEMDAYTQRAVERYGESLLGMDISIEGDEAVIEYKLKAQPFERIRRITGYLVGTMDKWNDAKRAEEHDRVKHDVQDD